MLRITERKRKLLFVNGSWELESEESREVKMSNIDLLEASIDGFVKFGGTEHAEFAETPVGSKLSKLVSTSPCKTMRTIRSYLYEEV